MTNFKGVWVIQLYYQPHISRRKEAAFVQALIEKLQITEVIAQNYPIPDLPAELETRFILEEIDEIQAITPKWLKLRKQIIQLPPIIKVFLNSKKISCDVVILKDRVPHFIEYHEKQHKNLSGNKPKLIYTIDNEPIIVPRYMQRFIRDAWRARHLLPFTVVWDHEFRIEDLAQQIFGE